MFLWSVFSSLNMNLPLHLSLYVCTVTYLHVNLDFVTSTCPGLRIPGMALSPSPELSPYQCVYLHPGNCLTVKAILHVSAAVENVAVYSTKLMLRINSCSQSLVLKLKDLALKSQLMLCYLKSGWSNTQNITHSFNMQSKFWNICG